MESFISNIKSKKPLIHCITNYVTVNDVANSIIAIGASPVMADDVNEVSKITTLSSGLLINLGTLNSKTISSMEKSLDIAKSQTGKKIATVLDPVGVGVSKLRNDTAIKFIENYKFDVIKGNISEIKFLAGIDSFTKGVDASSLDEKDGLSQRVKIARDLSQKTGSVIVITGEVDIVSDSKTSYLCKNGTFMMGKFSGSGCILGGIIAAFCSVNEDTLKASLAATLSVGIAGELAGNSPVRIGNMSFKHKFIDEIYFLNDETLKSRAKFEEIGEIK
ncbi:MAG: hydroxyethylthiazole kinase [Campylobacteraceae bacterium]|nr:hydroxyethylthiazole kinase [Campylobacteraceae bacterium]